jgi:hypothetical protein
LTFFSSSGWESWDGTGRPVIPERMPVLVDDDLRFDDEDGARPAVTVNRWHSFTASEASVLALVRHPVPRPSDPVMPADSRRRKACSAAARLSPVRRITP